MRPANRIKKYVLVAILAAVLCLQNGLQHGLPQSMSSASAASLSAVDQPVVVANTAASATDFVLAAAPSMTAAAVKEKTMAAAAGTTVEDPPNSFRVLCYHDIRDDVRSTFTSAPESTAIDTRELVRHFSWLQKNGYRACPVVVRGPRSTPDAKINAVCCRPSRRSLSVLKAVAA